MGRWLCLFAAALAGLGTQAGWFDTGDMLMARARADSAYRVYGELRDVEGVPRDGLLFRLAECEMEMDECAQAVAHYRQLLASFPHSPYALETRFRLAAEDLQSPISSVRRRAVGTMLEYCYAPDPAPLAEEAALAAVTACYNSAWYHEAQRIATRMLYRRPQGDHAEALLRLLRWSAYRDGNLSALARLCKDSEDDEAMYLRAAAALAEGRGDEAREGFYVYLADQTNGQYRAMAKAELTKLLFESAAKSEKAGQAADAMATYDRIVEGFPGADAEEAMFRKATVAFGQKDWTNVCETIGTLLAENAETPRRSVAQYLRGVAEWKNGDTAAASNLVSQALADGLAPDYAAEARYFLDFITTNKQSRTEQVHQ